MSSPNGKPISEHRSYVTIISAFVIIVISFCIVLAGNRLAVDVHTPENVVTDTEKSVNATTEEDPVVAVNGTGVIAVAVVVTEPIRIEIEKEIVTGRGGTTDIATRTEIVTVKTVSEENVVENVRMSQMDPMRTSAPRRRGMKATRIWRQLEHPV